MLQVNSQIQMVISQPGCTCTCMPSEAISSANHEVSGSVHLTQGRTGRPQTQVKVHTLVSLQQKAFLPPLRVNPYPGTRIPLDGRGRLHLFMAL